MFQSALGAASRVKVSQSWNSKPPIRVFEALGTDPYLNVATEDWLLGNPGAHHGTHTLFLWRNDPTIVIGRHQNMYKEVNVALCEKEKVCLVRRHSGGGAVYQDLGNTNFSIFSPKQTFDKTFNFAFITKALASLGIQAASQGRNDLVLPDNRKISGSAFKHSAAYSLHHGTLMVDVDVNALTRLLNPNKLKLESKGVASVASRVANMRSLVPSLTHGALVTALARAFSSAHGYAEDPDHARQCEGPPCRVPLRHLSKVRPCTSARMSVPRSVLTECFSVTCPSSSPVPVSLLLPSTFWSGVMSCLDCFNL
eukprot:gnl/Spiro4/16719_TR8998_c0_g1_i1.p1 gnl/Spiro4/16719_TR8998_c0_g1~~gnl/Spiro4/16719_TR8998_c0_g1_i1.p1  ORF type:complete len:311 (-),score=47.17 gnl/Spiro4/16719_TR8998_c0_g1_i1:548-1480(-)